MPSRQFKHRSRSIQRTLLARWRALLTLCLILALESLYHVRSLLTESPAQPVDAPFHTTCQEPDVDAARANATIVMLARNGDLDGAVTAVRSLEKQFNRLYHYPITFLNDAPWSQTFIDALTAASSGAATFSTIDARAWGFPAWIDRAKAGREMQAQKAAGLMYADKASYHHMCRFNSGFFYDHPALRGYRWYWRVEPDVRYTCAITYDPFVEMERRGKRYGYAIALWEEGRTAPSLYRKVADWKAERRIATTSLWAALVDPSTAPWPLRKMLSFSRNRDAEGDLWNMCHFWSNFEIADMEFFRSKEYREFFDFLDADGGFYYERWGDAPVHSLAAALFLSPAEIHHFSDFGYAHPPFQYCPLLEKATGNFPQLKDMTAAGWKERFKQIGCRCDYDPALAKVIDPTCMNTIARILH